MIIIIIWAVIFSLGLCAAMWIHIDCARHLGSFKRFPSLMLHTNQCRIPSTSKKAMIILPWSITFPCTFWSNNDTARLHPIILTLGFSSILLNGYWACQNLLDARLYWSSKLLPFLTGNLKPLTATKKYLTAPVRSQNLLKSADILRFCIKPLTRKALMTVSQEKHVIKAAVDQWETGLSHYWKK